MLKNWRRNHLSFRYRIERGRRFVDGVKRAWKMRKVNHWASAVVGNVLFEFDRNGFLGVHPANHFSENLSDQEELLTNVGKALGKKAWLEEHGGWLYVEMFDGEPD